MRLKRIGNFRKDEKPSITPEDGRGLGDPFDNFDNLIAPNKISSDTKAHQIIQKTQSKIAKDIEDNKKNEAHYNILMGLEMI